MSLFPDRILSVSRALNSHNHNQNLEMAPHSLRKQSTTTGGEIVGRLYKVPLNQVYTGSVGNKRRSNFTQLYRNIASYITQSNDHNTLAYERLGFLVNTRIEDRPLERFLA